MSQEMEDVEVVPSRSQTPTLQPEEPVFISQCRPDFGSHKYKQTILQRYLYDTFSHAGRTDHVDSSSSAFNKTRGRRPSGSIGSRDYEEMSTSSGVSMSNDSYNYYSALDGKQLRINTISVYF